MAFRFIIFHGPRTFGYVGMLMLLGSALPTSGDVFQLANGGEVSGDLVNVDRTGEDPFVVRPFAGGQVTLAASSVRDIISQRPIEIEYVKKRLHVGDSVKRHLELAQWCRKNRLQKESNFHLQQVLVIDPDHPKARRLLGYGLVDGEWMTQDEKMRLRGYVRNGNRWVLPQEKELKEKQKKQKQDEFNWYEKVKRYTKWLVGPKRPTGREHLLDITDPDAVPALIHYFKKAKRQENVEILARALSNVATPEAFKALVDRTIVETDDDITFFCLEILEPYKPPQAVAAYVDALRSKDNRKVNRAGRGLSFVGDPSVVRALINALVTQHKFKLGSQNPGAVSTSFGGPVGNKGTGFASGGGPKIVAQNMRNKEVLGALRSITGKDFDYDLGAWNNWYESQKPPAPKINSRRDEG